MYIQRDNEVIARRQWQKISKTMRELLSRSKFSGCELGQSRYKNGNPHTYRKTIMEWLPKRGDGREVAGGGHDGESDDGEYELKEPQDEAADGAG